MLQSKAKPVRMITLHPKAVQAGQRLCLASICCIWAFMALIRAATASAKLLLMEASAVSDSALKLLASLCSSSFITLSIACRSLSVCERRRSASVVPAPFFSINCPLQPPFLAALPVFDGYVVPALPGDLQARFLQRPHDPGPVLHVAGHDPLDEIAGDRLPVGQPLRALLRPLRLAGTLRVVRASPALLQVQRVPQRIVEPLPTRRSDIERLTGRQLDARHHEVQLDPAAFGVLVAYPQNVVLVRLQAGEGGALELVHDLVLVGCARRVLGREADHPRGVAPLPVDAVDQLARPLRCTAQHRGRRGLAALALGHVLHRPAPAASATGEELNQHARPRPRLAAR
jgi:hypothetical protein